MIAEFFYLIQTPSIANIREFWGKSHSRVKEQKFLTKTALLSHDVPKSFPVTITIVRMSPRELDSDNLQSAMKYIRDTIADHFIPGLRAGRADNDKGFTWNYAQEKSKIHAVKLIFYYPDLPE